jgi:hypothetical protein
MVPSLLQTSTRMPTTLFWAAVAYSSTILDAELTFQVLRRVSAHSPFRSSRVPSRTTTLSLARFTFWSSTRRFIVAQWQTICYVPCSVVLMTSSSTMSPRPLAHSIQVNDLMDLDVKHHIPLLLREVTSCFNVRCPSCAKFEDDDIPKIEMTYKSPEWDPADPDWASRKSPRWIRGDECTILRLSSPQDDGLLILCLRPSKQLTSRVMIIFMMPSRRMSMFWGFKSKNGHQAINPDTLTEKWLVLPEVAGRTLERTTQRGVRTISNPSLSRRFRTNDRQL